DSVCAASLGAWAQIQCSAEIECVASRYDFLARRSLNSYVGKITNDSCAIGTNSVQITLTIVLHRHCLPPPADNPRTGILSRPATVRWLLPRDNCQPADP